MKYIREARMGAPKSFKSGAILGTYPKPMLVFMFDNDGHSVLPSRSQPSVPGLVPVDTFYEDVVKVTPTDFAKWLAKPREEQPRILLVDFYALRNTTLALDVKAMADSTGMQAMVSVVDLLYRWVQTHKDTPLPWRTVVLDSLTGYMDIILSFIAQYNVAALADARQWAYQIGTKVKQTINAMGAFPAHTVMLMHTEIEKNDTTGVIRELPSVYSGLRNDIGGLFSQFFYSAKRGGKPVVWTTDQMLVTGIGPRWPQGLPPECGPDFASLYGKEGLT